MRRRILQSTLLVVAITALVLGGPLSITTWRLVEDIHRADLTSRLGVVAGKIDDPEVNGQIDTAAIEVAIPPGGRLVVQQANQPDLVIGSEVGSDAVTEQWPFGPGGMLTL